MRGGRYTKRPPGKAHAGYREIVAFALAKLTRTKRAYTALDCAVRAGSVKAVFEEGKRG